MNPIRRSFGAAGISMLLTAALVATGPGEPAASAPRYREWVQTIAPGLTMRRIVDLNTPRRIFVLTVDPSQPVSMDVALAQDRFGALEGTSGMATRHGAVAAVNGDFGSDVGIPTHPFAEDGYLQHSSTVPGIDFAISADEQSVFVDRPDQSVAMVQLDTGETLAVDRWNDGPPGVGEIAAYTPAGGTLEAPPPYACSVRLLPAGTPQPDVSGPGVTTSYTVEQSACSATPLERNGDVVLSALPASDEAIQLRSLLPGTGVRITWSFGWPNVLDAIGGVPLLLADGEVVITDCSSSFCHRNPRTGVGVTADGELLLVVVDGRQEDAVGMSLVEFAKLFQELGAVRAVNLDGGGSSTMVVEGEVVNGPSDGHERSVSTALLVLPGPEAGAAAPYTGAPRSGGSWAAFADPGSTGGMLDALARGQIGPPRYRLPRNLLRIVRLFRALR